MNALRISRTKALRISRTQKGDGGAPTSAYWLEENYMKSVADIFNMVATSSTYRESIKRGYGMCNALGYAEDSGLITRYERRMAEEDIEWYMEHLTGHNKCVYMRAALRCADLPYRSEEPTSELQSLMRTSYPVFALRTKYSHSNRSS